VKQLDLKIVDSWLVVDHKAILFKF